MLPPNDGFKESKLFAECLDSSKRSFPYENTLDDSDVEKKRKMDEKKEIANMKRKKTFEENKKKREGLVLGKYDY